MGPEEPDVEKKRSLLEHWALQNEATEVIPNIFVGKLPTNTLSPAIAAIVSILTPPQESYTFLAHLPSSTALHFIPISDTSDAPLILYLPDALHFLYLHRDRPCLIHCLYGTSRAPSVALAYILAYHRNYLANDRIESNTSKSTRVVRNALITLQETYPYANPSPSFLEQLDVFLITLRHTTGNDTPDFSKLYPFPWTNAQVVRTLTRLVADTRDVTSFSRLCNGLKLSANDRRRHCGTATNLLCCNKCTEKLAPQSTYGTKSVIVVAPMPWMAQSVLSLHRTRLTSIRLKCPRCHARIGRFTRSPSSSLPASEAEFSLLRSAVNLHNVQTAEIIVSNIRWPSGSKTGSA